MISDKKYTLLLEGKRQAKERFLNKGLLSQDAFDTLVASDPTPQKKYIEKLCEFFIYLNNEDPEYSSQPEIQILQHLNDLIMMYHDSNNKNKFAGTRYNDIMRFKSFDTFKNVTYEYYAQKTESEKKKESNKYNVREGNNAKIVYEDNDWLVTMPYNWEGVKYYGMGTRWCITFSRPNYFKEYFWDKGSSFYFINSKVLDRQNSDPREKHRFYKVAAEIDIKGNILAFWDAPDTGNSPVSNDPEFIEWYSKVPNYVKDLVNEPSPLGKVIHSIGDKEVRSEMFNVKVKGNNAIFEYKKGTKVPVRFADFDGIESFEHEALQVINNQMILHDAPLIIENTSLKNLKGIPETTGRIIIKNNPYLISLEGLPKKIPSSIEIVGNKSLSDISAMKEVTVTRDFRFADNKAEFTLPELLKDYKIRPKFGRIITR